jgi:hypothetical protein
MLLLFGDTKSLDERKETINHDTTSRTANMNCVNFQEKKTVFRA